MPERRTCAEHAERARSSLGVRVPGLASDELQRAAEDESSRLHRGVATTPRTRPLICGAPSASRRPHDPAGRKDLSGRRRPAGEKSWSCRGGLPVQDGGAGTHRGSARHPRTGAEDAAAGRRRGGQGLLGGSPCRNGKSRAGSASGSFPSKDSLFSGLAAASSGSVGPPTLSMHSRKLGKSSRTSACRRRWLRQMWP
jgi:hypothetical protein